MNKNHNLTLSQKLLNGEYNPFIVIFLAMLYITSKLACNLMFLRPLEISLLFFQHSFLIPSASFLYPAIYVLNIGILMLSNKRIAVIVALVGILCDGIFSFGSGYIVQLPIPHSMTPSELTNTLAINAIGGYMWDFYLKGILISIVVSIISLEIYLLLNKMNFNLFVNMVIATYIPTIIHHMVMLSPRISVIDTINIFEKYSIIYLSALVVSVMVVISIKQMVKIFSSHTPLL